ncbi:terminase [Clostridium botulinum]|uniref:Terminase n=2 Tax=Clostridium botulinum TaxID=1491 RepID=A0A6G4HQ87_CLOBO|nr:terminase small subunit [Clostridium botulinum]MBO0571870.1 terminase [Clostridium botulinum]NFJ61681.1 terminase [Clostridium botulinum]NFQ62468.1 terminase [Clostridium botulinum]NFR17690.1 terminase [Clostridium botulinum]NFU16789.1 terminase [Clostridium botulinum]
MENIRGPDWNLIKEEYLKLNGNVKLKEFAEKHGVKYSTLRSRKNRENWDSEINENVATKSATQQKNVATENKNKNNKAEPKLKEVNEVSKNTELTDKQRLFCVYYIKYRNKTKAYMKAYQCSWENANAHAYELWENVGVRNEIEKQLQELYDNIGMSVQDLIQKNIDIINCDMNDFLDVQVRGEDHKYNEVLAKSSDEIDGTLINEIKQNKYGVSIKLYDKTKAIDSLHGMLKFKAEEKLKLERLNLENKKLNAEIDKISDLDDSIIEDDGFIEALNGTAQEDWADEEEN